jgi:glucose/arabinose dehydrogenase
VGTGQGGVRLEKVGSFDQPVYVTQPAGERNDLFVVEQPGRVVVVRNGKVSSKPFLDVSGQVSCCGEQGLLSIAFAPDYRQSGHVYADFTDTAGDTRVVEYTRSSSDPLTVDPATARTVLAVNQPYPNHNGGQLQFGPDGDLYVGLGDGGSEGDPNRLGQDLSTPLAKILRITPSGGVPKDNPFVGRAGARPETFAYGLRNPWRFSFDSRTGDLWIGDVGQDNWEEVDGITFRDAAGANFGWSAFEGDQPFNSDQHAAGAVRPVLTYSHANGCSVTGGYVVRDRSLPTLYGRYLYGDFCNGVLRSFTAIPGRPATDDRALGLQVPSLSSFGLDSAGHVYATSLNGPVYRLVASGAG